MRHRKTTGHSTGFDNRIREKNVTDSVFAFYDYEHRAKARKMSRYSLSGFLITTVLFDWDMYYGDKRLPKRIRATISDVAKRNRAARTEFCRKLEAGQDDARLLEWRKDKAVNKQWASDQFAFVRHYLGTGMVTDPVIKLRKWTAEEVGAMRAWLEKRGYELVPDNKDRTAGDTP